MSISTMGPAATAGRPQTQGSSRNLQFRFSDINPLTRRAYRSSRFNDLPYLVAVVVQTELGLTSRAWNALVRSGAVAEVVDCFLVRALPWTLDRAVPVPGVDGPAVGRCPDCGGTGVDRDVDGSISGVVGAALVCCCRIPARRGSR